MFLVDKYRPKKISDMIFHREIIEELAYISIHENVPHVIISGPPECGKRVLANFFLELLYTNSIYKLSKRDYSIHSASSKKELIEIQQSSHHIIIEPTNTNHDKIILQEIIKDYARRRTFDDFTSTRKFKSILIYNLENLASSSQAALRRTMEIYAKTCRFIFICNNLSKVLDPLRSRCRIFSVGYPSLEQINRTLCHISLMEGISLMGKQQQVIQNKIFKKCDGNIKKAVWTLDILRLTHDNNFLQLPCDQSFNLIVKMIMTAHTCKDIVSLFDDKIRNIVYDLLITNIRGTDIIINILNRLLEQIDDWDICAVLAETAREAEFNLVHGRREIIHIDFFIATAIKLILVNNTNKGSKAK
jgi:replication factor C subunit 3/5